MEIVKKKYQRKIINLNTLFYINTDGIKITIYSPYELMVNEMLTLGINPHGKTIKELQRAISQICLDAYMEANFDNASNPKENNYMKTSQYAKNILISYYLKELEYWLYDFKLTKIPNNLKFDFELYQKSTIR